MKRRSWAIVSRLSRPDTMTLYPAEPASTHAEAV